MQHEIGDLQEDESMRTCMRYIFRVVLAIHVWVYVFLQFCFCLLFTFLEAAVFLLKALWGGHTAALQFMLGIQLQVGERKHAIRDRRFARGRKHEDMLCDAGFKIVSRILTSSIKIMTGASRL